MWGLMRSQHEQHGHFNCSLYEVTKGRTRSSGGGRGRQGKRCDANEEEKRQRKRKSETREEMR